MGGAELFPSEAPLEATVAELRAHGTEVLVVEPDNASLRAMGTNALDPTTRAPAAEAGRAQGRELELSWR
jgi:NTE family protein